MGSWWLRVPATVTRSSERPWGPRAKAFFFDATLVLVMAIAVVKLSGAEKWTTAFTPDSEFYFTLGVFGDEVTDRAPVPSYFWTKLGIIAPTRVLFALLGVGAGWTAYRVILLALLIGAIYFMVRWLNGTRLTASLISLMFALNTAFLFWLGNTYFSGAAMVSLTLALVFAAGLWIRRSVSPWALGIQLGLSLAWLVMINPYAGGLGIVTAGAIMLAGISTRVDIGRVLRAIAGIAIGFLAGLGVFFIAAQILFPRLNWIETVVGTTTSLDYRQYSTPDAFVWISTATSLLVPVVGICLSISMAVSSRMGLASRLALASSVSSFVFSIIWAWAQGGITVEAQYYAALLWPGAFIAFALFVASIPASSIRRVVGLFVATGVFAILALLGHASGDAPVVVVVAVAVVVAASAIVVASTRLSVRPWALPVVVLLLSTSMTVAQNYQPQSAGRSTRLPYSRAFVDNSEEVNVERNLAVESWVLGNTTDDDKLFVWVEPETFVTPPAAMQLYGPNSMTSGWDLGEWEKANLINHRPTILVTYAFAPTAVDTIASALRGAGFGAETFACDTFQPYTYGGPNLTVCLTRIGYPPVAA